MGISILNDDEYRVSYEDYCFGFARREKFLEEYGDNVDNSYDRRTLAYSLMMVLIYRKIDFMMEYEKNAKSFGVEL